MSAAVHLSLADVKNRLTEVVDTLEREHGRVVVTKHGRPAAVMLRIEDLSNRALLDTIRHGQTDVAAGRTERLSREEALARVAKR